MPTKTKQSTKTPDVNLREPSPEEIEAARTSTFRVVIGENIGTPSEEVAAQIPSVYGEPIQADRLFVLPMFLSNNLPDSYYTYMTPDTLDTYALQAAEGRALMLAHNTWGDMPVGQSYGGAVEQFTPEETRDIMARNGISRMGRWAGSVLHRLLVNWYIVRGGRGAEKENDAIIDAVETRTYRDGSIGFLADDLRCDICGLSMLTWDCPHFPGAEYEVADDAGREVEQIALAAVIGGQMLEGSLVYKGATPEASIVGVKARMMAAQGELGKREIAVINRLEARLGHRVMDPAYLLRATRTIVPVRVPLNRTKQEKENSPMSTPQKNGKSARTARPARRQEDVATVEAAVADLTTAAAGSLAERITALETQIAGLEEQIAAAQAADPQDPDLIASLETQLEGAQAELAALQAELDAVNTVAEDVGGTPADPPATSEPVMGELALRAQAATRLAREFTRKYLTPLRGTLTRITQEEADPIVTALNDVIAQVQALITETGQNALRSIPDQVVFNYLARQANVPVEKLGFAHVRSLVNQAEAGREYLRQLQDDCVKAHVGAVGADNVDEEHYRATLRNLDLKSLQRELELQEKARGQAFQGGQRRVWPNLVTSDESASTGRSQGEEGGVYARQRRKKQKSIVGL